ncbi:helix-turn-helix transcriptional regulator [Nocardia sp. CNY236]|uniref:helix-turn-helix domain-containing protein n=1 Tax=Nocardia sp. CNY236 TaxID=1169152 RepID=UPI000415A992|nr:helix-turn-helix transcriptional regulator [Nocardia sp. CNY236]
MATRTARGLLLGREINYMIRASGASQAEAGRIIEVGQSRINSLIAGTGRISAGDLQVLARGLGFTDEVYIQRLLELRRDKHQRGYWTSGHRRVYFEELRLLVDLEEQANRLRVAESEIIPGLLQSESYVRALHAHMSDDANGVTVEDWVQARLARQENLVESSGAPEFHAVLSESCLRRRYGDAKGEVMLDQLAHLVELSRRPNILIQVLPFNTPVPSGGMEDRYTLVRVPSPGAAGDLELAVVEALGEIRYIVDKPPVGMCEKLFARLSTTALSVQDSREFINHVARTIQFRIA